MSELQFEAIRPHAPSVWGVEMRALLKLALPLIATQVAQMAIMTTDVVMLGRIGKTEIAAAALGNTVFFFAWLVGCGPASAVSPMIAQILGARPGDRADVRRVVRMGLWVAVLLWLPLAFVLVTTEQILLLLGQSSVLASAAGLFMRPLALGLLFSVGYQVLRNYMTALGRPNSSLVVMAITVAFNALADYALIFGHFGLPRLGLLGSGIASTLSYAFSFFAMLLVALWSPGIRHYYILHHFARPHMDKFRELFRLGMPIGMTMMFEAMLFNTATLIMGTFGIATVAAHQIALNVASLTFMVPLGIGLAATVRVGLAAGALDRNGVKLAGKCAMAAALGFMTMSSILIATFPDTLAKLYFADTPDNADAIALTVVFLRVAAAFQIFDAVQVVASLSLRGLKDARAPMWLAGFSYWLAGFPVCIALGYGFALGGLGIWIGLAFALFVAAVTLTWRLAWIAGKAPLTAA
jgi:MATE family multidrug resistance protein